jgi:hypothetical protein
MYNASLCCIKVFVGFWDFVAPRYERLDALDPNQSCLTSSRGILSGVVTALKNCRSFSMTEPALSASCEHSGPDVKCIHATAHITRATLCLATMLLTSLLSVLSGQLAILCIMLTIR